MKWYPLRRTRASTAEEVTMFKGVYTAIITPFSNGEIDETALTALIERQVEAGVNGIVPCGTTGESATMSDEEILLVIKHTIETVNGRCQVIAGVGSNNTAQTIELALGAQSLGADGLLVITPYYNKPTQEGMFAHFKAVSEAVPQGAIMLYNVPGRTGVSLTVDTITRLAQIPNIVALKEATGDMAFAARIVSACGDQLNLLSGDDVTALPQWCVGGQGVVSVTSNLVPNRMVEMWSCLAKADVVNAQRIHLQLVPLFDSLFIESNPVPVKSLVALNTGLCGDEVRLPLTPLQPSSWTHLKTLCQRLEIGLNS
jgi:4-hydroxy-tetrahydrodipicolinate synthase